MPVGKTRSEYNAYMARYMKQRYRRRRAEFIKRLGGKCVVCGGTKRLEFDHVDPKKRLFEVGEALAGMAQTRLEKEMKKCQLLCRKHHNEKTLKERGFQSARCGTLSGYRYCKCDACKAAMSSWNRQYKQSRKVA